MGSFWNLYKMMGIVKTLKCCHNLYQVLVCPCPEAFFSKLWPCVDLDHFYDRVKFVSWCFCMGDRLYSIGCPCLSKFVLIQHILCTQMSDTGPMVLWLLTIWKKTAFLLEKLRKLRRVVGALCALGFKKDRKVRNLERYITQRSIPVWALTSRHTESE